MDAQELTPERVQEMVRLLAGIEIDREEAARVLPWASAICASAAALRRFDVAEARSTLGFDPTSPYR